MKKFNDLNEINNHRTYYNDLLKKERDFFDKFSSLDSEAYVEGAISKQTKELIGLTISLISRCDECIIYHLQECKNAGVSDEQIFEVLEMAVIGGGSIIYPSARLAVELLKSLNLKQKIE